MGHRGLVAPPPVDSSWTWDRILHWQEDSYPLNHLGRPSRSFRKIDSQTLPKIYQSIVWILTRFPGDSHALPSLKHPTSLSGERDYWDKRPRSSLVMLLLWWLLCGKCIAWFLACVHSLDKCLWAPVLCQLLCWFLGIESSRRIGPALIFYILVKF